jgi:hypothetical protein
MKKRSFWQGLVAAIIGGAATGGAHALSEGQLNPKTIGASAGVGALIAVAALFKHAPHEDTPEEKKAKEADAADETK